MVGHLLDGFDGLGVRLAEMLDQSQQVCARTRRQRFELGKTAVAQRDQPGHLHLDAALHVTLLAHGRTEFGQFGSVAAIQRGKG